MSSAAGFRIMIQNTLQESLVNLLFSFGAILGTLFTHFSVITLVTIDRLAWTTENSDYSQHILRCGFYHSNSILLTSLGANCDNN